MKKGIRSDIIKIIAMFCMLIDHIGALLATRLYAYVLDPDNAKLILDASKVCRIIGRVAFPIFCYQLVVGILRTSNRKKHLMLLAVFALISEIPFNLVASFNTFDIKHQNTMFTLLIGMLVVLALEWFYDSYTYNGENVALKDKILTVLFTVAVVTTGSVVAELMHTDYGAKGVILIALFYIMFSTSLLNLYTVAVLFLIEVAVITFIRYENINSVISYCETEAYALFAFPIIAEDNGIRKGGKIIKWAGYMFYPCHLILIFWIFNMITR